MNLSKWNWSTILAISSFIFGVMAAITSILYPSVAVISGVCTSLTSLMAVFVSNYQKWLDTPPLNPFSDTHVWSRSEQESFYRQAGGNSRNPNFIEWFFGRHKSVKLRKSA